MGASHQLQLSQIQMRLPESDKYSSIYLTRQHSNLSLLLISVLMFPQLIYIYIQGRNKPHVGIKNRIKTF